MAYNNQNLGMQADDEWEEITSPATPTQPKAIASSTDEWEDLPQAPSSQDNTPKPSTLTPRPKRNPQQEAKVAARRESSKKTIYDMGDQLQSLQTQMEDYKSRIENINIKVQARTATPEEIEEGKRLVGAHNDLFDQGKNIASTMNAWVKAENKKYSYDPMQGNLERIQLPGGSPDETTLRRSSSGAYYDAKRGGWWFDKNTPAPDVDIQERYGPPVVSKDNVDRQMGLPSGVALTPTANKSRWQLAQEAAGLVKYRPEEGIKQKTDKIDQWLNDPANKTSWVVRDGKKQLIRVGDGATRMGADAPQGEGWYKLVNNKLIKAEEVMNPEYSRQSVTAKDKIKADEAWKIYGGKSWTGFINLTRAALAPVKGAAFLLGAKPLEEVVKKKMEAYEDAAALVSEEIGEAHGKGWKKADEVLSGAGVSIMENIPLLAVTGPTSAVAGGATASWFAAKTATTPFLNTMVGKAVAKVGEKAAGAAVRSAIESVQMKRQNESDLFDSLVHDGIPPSEAARIASKTSNRLSAQNFLTQTLLEMSPWSMGAQATKGFKLGAQGVASNYLKVLSKQSAEELKRLSTKATYWNIIGNTVKTGGIEGIEEWWQGAFEHPFDINNKAMPYDVDAKFSNAFTADNQSFLGSTGNSLQFMFTKPGITKGIEALPSTMLMAFGGAIGGGRSLTKSGRAKLTAHGEEYQKLVTPQFIPPTKADDITTPLVDPAVKQKQAEEVTQALIQMNADLDALEQQEMAAKAAGVEQTAQSITPEAEAPLSHSPLNKHRSEAIGNLSKEIASTGDISDIQARVAVALNPTIMVGKSGLEVISKASDVHNVLMIAQEAGIDNTLLNNSAMEFKAMIAPVEAATAEFIEKQKAVETADISAVGTKEHRKAIAEAEQAKHKVRVISMETSKKLDDLVKSWAEKFKPAAEQAKAETLQIIPDPVLPDESMTTEEYAGGVQAEENGETDTQPKEGLTATSTAMVMVDENVVPKPVTKKEDFRVRATLKENMEGEYPLGMKKAEFKDAAIEFFGPKMVIRLNAMGLFNIYDKGDKGSERLAGLKAQGRALRHEGKAEFAAWRIHSKAQAVAVVLHEVGVHIGLYKFLGEDGYKNVARMLKNAYKAKDEMIVKAWDDAYDTYKGILKLGDNSPYLVDNYAFMEEVLGRVVNSYQTKKDAKGYLKSIVDYLKKTVHAWFKEMAGGQTNLTVDDVFIAVVGSIESVTKSNIEVDMSRDGSFEISNGEAFDLPSPEPMKITVGDKQYEVTEPHKIQSLQHAKSLTDALNAGIRQQNDLSKDDKHEAHKRIGTAHKDYKQAVVDNQRINEVPPSVSDALGIKGLEWFYTESGKYVETIKSLKLDTSEKLQKFLLKAGVPEADANAATRYFESYRAFPEKDATEPTKVINVEADPKAVTVAKIESPLDVFVEAQVLKDAIEEANASVKPNKKAVSAVTNFFAGRAFFSATSERFSRLSSAISKFTARIVSVKNEFAVPYEAMRNACKDPIQNRILGFMLGWTTVNSRLLTEEEIKKMFPAVKQETIEAYTTGLAAMNRAREIILKAAVDMNDQILLRHDDVKVRKENELKALEAELRDANEKNNWVVSKKAIAVKKKKNAIKHIVNGMQKVSDNRELLAKKLLREGELKTLEAELRDANEKDGWAVTKKSRTVHNKKIEIEKIDKEMQQVRDNYDSFEKKLMKDPYYWPLSRFGKYKITYKHKVTGEVLAVFLVDKIDDKEELNKQIELQSMANPVLKKAIEEKNAVAGRPIELRDVTDAFTGESPFNVDGALLAYYDAAAKLAPETSEQLELAVMSGKSSDVFKSHLISRRGVPGWSTDAFKTFDSYIHSLSSTVANMEHALKMDDELKTFTQNYAIEHDINYDARLHEQARGQVDHAKHPPSHQLVNKVLAIGFIKDISARPAFAIAQMTQLAASVLPALGAFYGYKRAAIALRYGLKIALRNVGWTQLDKFALINKENATQWVKEHVKAGNFIGVSRDPEVRERISEMTKEMILRAADSGSLQAAPSFGLPETVIGDKFEKIAEAFGVVALKSEQINRIATLTAWAILNVTEGEVKFNDDKGFTKSSKKEFSAKFDNKNTKEGITEAVYRSGETINELTNYIRGRGNQPKYLRFKGFQGSVARLMFNYKNFSIGYMLEFHALGIISARKAGEGKLKKTLAYAKPQLIGMGIQALMGGPKAYVYFKLLETLLKVSPWGEEWLIELYDAIAKRFKKALKPAAKKLVLGDEEADRLTEKVLYAVCNGLPTLTGVDMSSMLEGDLITTGNTPAETLGTMFLGANGNSFAKVLTEWRKYGFALNQLGKALKHMIPSFLRGPIEAYKGEASVGGVAVPLTTEERALRVAGLQPTRIAAQREKLNTEFEVKAWWKENTKRFATKYKDAYHGKKTPDAEEVKAVRDEFKAFVNEHKDLMKKYRIKPSSREILAATASMIKRKQGIDIDMKAALGEDE